MSYTLSNHRHVELNPVGFIPIVGDYDPLPYIKSTLVDPIYEPLMPGTQASLLDAAGNPVDPDDLVYAFLRTMTGTFDASAEKDLKDLLRQGLITYTGQTPLRINELFPVQAQEKTRNPHPVGSTRYFAKTDVIPGAKKLLATGDDDELLMSLSYTYSPEVLGFWFLSETAYEDFKFWMQTELAPLSAQIPTGTQKALASFYQSKLDEIVEGIYLRATEADNMEDYSFARIIVHMLTKYVELQKNNHAASITQSQQNQPGQQSQQSQPRLAGMLPFLLSELYLPKHIVLVNAELHANSSANKIDAAWKLINTAIQIKPTVISNNALSKMSTLPRALAKSQRQIAHQASKMKKAGRSAKVVFRKQSPQPIMILDDLLRALKRMGSVNKSQNSVRKQKTSFSRANRRRPDDPNLPGKTTSIQYMPDIHIYLDCSGSVSEENYQSTIIMLIKIAKKLNINLYFSSFSHVLSQPVMLRTKGKSTSAIWTEFRRIPKVSGGTDFEQIWDFVNESPVRKRRLNIIVTDFEWSASTQRVKHSPNTYYSPLAGMNWRYMKNSAKRFADSMSHIEPGLPAKFFGMTK